MQIKNFFKGALMTLTLSLAANVVGAQNAPASPAATATGKLKGGAAITINYSSPSVKGRQIWGALVPFDKVWRAGANNATVIETSKDVTVEGKTLSAGKYSVFAIPTEKECVVIFNTQVGQSGMSYDAKKDAFRVTVKNKKSASMNERLVYTINENGFVLSWENLDIPVSMK